MTRLVNDLMHDGYLKNDAIIEAFTAISRIEFVPRDFEKQAEMNIPLPIGHGQTISQPLTVAFMLELLEPQEGQHVLDIGSGSGWTTALLAHIVGKKGKVTAIERIPELCEFGKSNVEKYKFISSGIAEMHCTDGSQGFAKNAPYDRILVSAASEEAPKSLLAQLKTGGKMVIPIYNYIWYFEKRGTGEYYNEKFPGFVFVPLVQKSPL